MARSTGTAGPGGISVKVHTGDMPRRKEPTRFALMLRRQAANRRRVRDGREPLPAISPGRCAGCQGFGVIGSNRIQCPDCGGSGG